jgi:iron(III) transport system permease protein
VRVSSISLLPISPQLDEAGRVLGAGLFRRLRTLTFPLMRPGILSAWMLIFIFATNEISATILLYTPQSQTIAVRVWTAVQTLGAMQAFAYATVQSIIVGIVLFVAYRFLGLTGHGDPQTSRAGPARGEIGDGS